MPAPSPTVMDGQQPPSLLDATVAAAVEHSIEQARRDGTNPKAVIGATPPVLQPDSRIVPAWAAGIAVASIGVGAGSTGLGCAAWLACQGLAAVSLPSLDRCLGIVIAPFAGTAMVLVALASVIKRLKNVVPDEHHHHYEEVVVQNNTEITNHNSLWGHSSTNPEENP